MTIQRGQTLVVIPNESVADGTPALHPEMILSAGPLGMRTGGVRLVNPKALAPT